MGQLHRRYRKRRVPGDGRIVSAGSSNPFSLEGRQILVTGASSGIGEAAARMCANMGARVIACGRNTER
ncbi:MAG: SDR family NAD(P)-dependent oxidoreductase, partial [Telluria sp.]